jgi:hypothetical protein
MQLISSEIIKVITEIEEKYPNLYVSGFVTDNTKANKNVSEFIF